MKPEPPEQPTPSPKTNRCLSSPIKHQKPIFRRLSESTPRTKKSHKPHKFSLSDINTPNKNGETPLMLSTRQNKGADIHILLYSQYIDVNHTNQWGNTALHIACMFRCYNSLNALLRDPRINPCIKNFEDKTPLDCLLKETDDDKLWRNRLFARIMLHTIVEQESFASLISGDIANEKKIVDTIQEIKKRFMKDRHNQEDYQPLPDETSLPDYVTDDFIKKMIFHLLNLQVPQ